MARAIDSLGGIKTLRTIRRGTKALTRQQPEAFDVAANIPAIRQSKPGFAGTILTSALGLLDEDESQLRRPTLLGGAASRRA